MGSGQEHNKLQIEKKELEKNHATNLEAAWWEVRAGAVEGYRRHQSPR
jgi:hypothetical protein